MRKQLSTLDQLVKVTDAELYRHLDKWDSTNFFFFFRMLLVWFKREFEWNDVLSLWERLWTDYLSGEFIIFIALAVLRDHRKVSTFAYARSPYKPCFYNLSLERRTDL